MDNPLVNFGDDVYQPQQPINITYDAFGPPAAMIRGLFEYLYKADRLVLVPHIPPGVTQLQQRDPIRFGTKKLYLSTAGTGHITQVTLNDNVWTEFTKSDVTLPYDQTPDEARIVIRLGYDAVQPLAVSRRETSRPANASDATDARLASLRAFQDVLKKLGASESYAAAHACLAERAMDVIAERKQLFADRKIEPLAAPASAEAAEKLYADTAEKLFAGFVAAVEKDEKLREIWRSVSGK
jgi:hypothetical protein